MAKSTTVKKIKSVKKKGKVKKAPPTPAQKLQASQKRTVRRIFEAAGFSRVRTDGVEFKFKTRTGELDDMFLFDNVLVVAEYTIGASGSGHISTKGTLFNLIDSNQEDFARFASELFPSLRELVDKSNFSEDQYKVRICYVSLAPISEEMEESFPSIRFMDATKLRYFDALARTIHRTSRFELLKFLQLDFSEVGKEVFTTSSMTHVFEGHLLPESHSSFPPGFKVASFYADPATLLMMSYVLRRDSWRTDEGLYQRVLVRSRMAEMRKYLVTEGRVFINNIIVTLPADTTLNEPGPSGKNLDPKKLSSVTRVAVSLPLKADTIGLIDGQHRVFCYHEGVDKFEAKIKKIRDRQNLLVTGIVFPKNYTDFEKRQFEAKLFLEINDKQKRARSELKQSIELILNPFSNVAISKAVIQRLNERGALKGMLQTNFFDPTSFIKTTSIVSYGLRPLVKLDGTDSLFSIWRDGTKNHLRDAQRSPASVDDSAHELLTKYIEFCTTKINDLLIAAKIAIGTNRWKIDHLDKKPNITPTVLNGFFVCMRRLAQENLITTQANYSTAFGELSKFDFSKYKSSQWKQLGDTLFIKYF